MLDHLSEYWPPYLAFIILIGLICLGIETLRANRAYEERLIAQCIADGKKEYECRAMFHTKGSTTILPMPVYIGR